MTTPNNLNTEPLVLNEDHTHADSHINGNGTANGQSVADHAINAKDSLLNCKVRYRPQSLEM